MSTGFGLKELCDGFRAKHDDYNAIMAEAIADRLAEAFAECLHQRVARGVGLREERGSHTARAHRREVPRHPARGGLPGVSRSHGERHALESPRRGEAHAGMLITESFAMWPGSSVSGLYFAHPEARYFTLGKIDRDQVRGLRGQEGHDHAGSGALAGPESQLRPGQLNELRAGPEDSRSEPVSARCRRRTGTSPGSCRRSTGNARRAPGAARSPRRAGCGCSSRPARRW